MDGAVHTALHAVLFFAQQPVHGNLQNVRDHHHLKVSHKPAAVFDPAYHVPLHNDTSQLQTPAEIRL